MFIQVAIGFVVGFIVTYIAMMFYFLKKEVRQLRKLAQFKKSGMTACELKPNLRLVKGK